MALLTVPISNELLLKFKQHCLNEYCTFRGGMKKEIEKLITEHLEKA